MDDPKTYRSRRRIDLSAAIYQHTLPTMQKEAAEKMNRILGNLMPQKAADENGRN